MTETRFPELSIQDLLAREHYIVPRYQRNYAWTEEHIKQLIDDILDSLKAGQKKPILPYYIGTLVVFPRNTEKNRIQYEVIDGQQRLTTLTLIASYLTFPERFKGKEANYWFNEINLGFESRPRSTKTLQAAHNGVFHDNQNYQNSEEAYTEEIEEAYGIVKRLVPGRCAEYGFFESEFADYFLRQVKICRVSVPPDTDLNHYFEIMNNRGEQLEKHELLKAQLLSRIENGEEACIIFNRIWEACSIMDRYIQYCFSTSHRKALFGETWNKFIPKDRVELFQTLRIEYNQKDPEGIPLSFSTDGIPLEGKSRNPVLSQIISGYKSGKNKPGNNGKEEEPERFSSIINFPNFLLHVLSIFLDNGKIALDDKQLLSSFDQLDGNKVLDFGYCLLKSRFLFDQYVIKRDATEDERDWSLKELHLTPSNHPSYRMVFSSPNGNKETIQKRISLLQSMFHVSVPSRTYKYWLQALLRFLLQEETITGERTETYLFDLARAFVYNRFLSEKPLGYPQVIFDNNGKPDPEDQLSIGKTSYGQIENILIFNFLDYLLWLREINNSSLKSNERIKNFTFTFRSSVEHYYPQNPINGERLKNEKILHSLGNLCLISHSENSSLRHNLPLAKAERYAKAKYITTIKQYVMMSDAEHWSENPADAIEVHHKEMISIYKEYCP